MSTIRKQYDREFKVMAVELSKGCSDLSVLSSYNFKYYHQNGNRPGAAKRPEGSGLS